MIVTIHQPNFLPYLGFFDKILKSDIFIIYDTAQYVKGNFMNRNKINNNGNELYITLSVKKDSWKKLIKDVILNNNDKNYIKIFKTLDSLYKKSKCLLWFCCNKFYLSGHTSLFIMAPYPGIKHRCWVCVQSI